MAGKTFKGIKRALSQLSGQKRPKMTFSSPHLVSEGEAWVEDMIDKTGPSDEMIKVRKRYKERYQKLMEEKSRSLGSNFNFTSNEESPAPRQDKGCSIIYQCIYQC